MKRQAKCLAVWFFVPLAVGFAQDVQYQPAPIAPSDILGPRLIAWSQVQEPRPVRESEPQSAQSVQPDQSSGAVLVLTGTLVNETGRYILQVSKSTAYPLDDQQNAKRYEGKQVRVTGVMNSKGNSFHVTKIELVS